MQFKPQRVHNFHNRCEFGVAIGRERFVEALAPKACVMRDLCHALCASNVTERGGDERGVAFFECGFNVSRDVFLGFEVFGGIPYGGF